MKTMMEIIENVPEVAHCTMKRGEIVNGQVASEVVATLADGRTVTGTFVTEQRSAFGGVEFKDRKDIVGLMTSKIQSVLRGTAE